MGILQIAGLTILGLAAAAALGWAAYRFWWAGDGGPSVSAAPAAGWSGSTAPPGAATGTKGSRRGGRDRVAILAALLVIVVVVLRPDRSGTRRRS